MRRLFRFACTSPKDCYVPRSNFKDSSVDVVEIDEEEAILVTSEYVPPEDDMVYTMTLGPHGYASSSTLSRGNHRAYCGWALESGRSRSTIPRRQAILRAEAWY